ncbi:MAG: Crp/Fnr family transcriptional regulator [Fusobacterium gastrosuis]|uniref:Crp/Fnr family transcriptional regulator n=1 Tax=Fusobacterium TaxID=848 RepID=UPI001F4F38EF|nr:MULTISPECIES: Crp/Fnr family transcriptional regulator [Fusobacterium]MDD7392306.1 Crp/Fnr family transcriptional regulator [Fusobacteriaceae bacterium]MCI5724639.1 Crp/Fnr family transcriptional regulator [Fusobacterium sp.]MCI7222988.1 Crp/Fnr family transcriptional regulator [Fusobacterium sp.]MDD7410049.1 Crp/Fnr family transcriptional regulator [Fusobacteriaceae bacterium]MDY4011847.1 Crp/Fnr family transcriptional regulator [Fusobacterium gastrosuis]
MINREDIKLLENIFSFWNDIKVDDRAKIILSTRLMTIKKGSTFFSSSDLEGIIFLKCGKLRFFISSLDSRELTLYILRKNDIEFLSHYDDSFSAISSIEFTAEENSEILFIPYSVLELFRCKYCEIEKFLHTLTNLKFKNSLLALQGIILIPLKNRVITFLKSFNSNEITITHEEIAKNLSSSREVISKILKNLEKENSIKLYRNKIILNF